MTPSLPDGWPHRVFSIVFKYSSDLLNTMAYSRSGERSWPYGLWPARQSWPCRSLLPNSATLGLGPPMANLDRMYTPIVTRPRMAGGELLIEYTRP